MRNWMLLLLAALLLYAGCARAEDVYYTNNEDIYYHADPDCDRPVLTNRESEQEWEIYDRDCYRKYPISEVAALAFAKGACPICIKGFSPVYLGEYPPERKGEGDEPWGPGGLVYADMTPYKMECIETHERFMNYHRENPYLENLAGFWENCSGGYTYAIVDPEQWKLEVFQDMFGGGAWIVPAKYDYNYTYTDRAITKAETSVAAVIEKWRATHTELDFRIIGIMRNEVDGVVEVEMGGADWEEGMRLMDAELNLPIWVCFLRTI